MKRILGKIVFALAMVWFVCIALYALGECLTFLYHKFGTIAVIIGLIFSPLTLLIVSICIGIVTGKWFLVGVICIGGFLGQVAAGLGLRLQGKR